MILQIITRTPVWVWALLALLIGLGYQQTKSRTVGLRRVTIIPVILTTKRASCMSSEAGCRWL